MKTLATAQLSTHQSAGDVIGSVNGVGVMCCGRSMAQQCASLVHCHHHQLQPPLGDVSLFLNTLMALK